MRTSLISKLGAALLLLKPFALTQAEDWRVERPDFCQTDERHGELPLGGYYHCTPTSVSNHLISLGKEFPNLIPSKDPTLKDQVELIKTLSSPDYMNTDTAGTYLSDLIKGLKKYVEERDYNISITYKGLEEDEKIERYFTGKEITAGWIKEKSKDKWNLILAANFYKNEDGDLELVGAHSVTVIGGNDDDELKFKLHIHDPATRSGLEPKTETCNLIFHPENGIEIQGIKLKRNSDVAFVRYIVAFKIEEPKGD